MITIAHEAMAPSEPNRPKKTADPYEVIAAPTYPHPSMNPVAVDKEDVPQEVVDKEIEIGKEQAKREGKPDELLEKIAMGKLGKFFKESTLLNQEFIKDNKKTIRQFLTDTDKELTVIAFKRFSLTN